MKKLASIMVFVFAFAITMQAQKTEHSGKKMHKKETLTVDQRATLSSKRLALALDLSPAQVRKIKPLLAKQITDREAMVKKMKASKKKGKKRVKQGFDKMNKSLDARLDFQNKMKSILTEKQYETFKKLKMKKKRKGEMRVKKKTIKMFCLVS